jgi:hypothetical protein
VGVVAEFEERPSKMLRSSQIGAGTRNDEFEFEYEDDLMESVGARAFHDTGLVLASPVHMPEVRTALNGVRRDSYGLELISYGF